jgi:Zn-dependent peptidase ImmA (M78 family)/transcriptional regulator with XRE-family HTH domain
MNEVTLDEVTLGRQLRYARDKSGISQQAAAAALGIPRTAITNIESGARSVSTLELTKLAKLYRVPVNVLVEEIGENNEDLLIVLHRAAPGIEENPAVRDQIAHCLELCQVGTQLEALLGRPLRDTPSRLFAPLPTQTSQAVRQGENLAEEERRRMGLGTLPIADLPDLLAMQGIWASSGKLLEGMSGLFLHHPLIGMAILVNAAHQRTRQRFSYAHEYAHVLLDRDGPVSISSASNAADLIEKRANAFAAAFLMPSKGVTDLLRQLGKGGNSRQEQVIFDVATGGRINSEWRASPGSLDITYQDVASMAHHFGVSYQAAVYRLRSLSHISHKESQDLLAQEHIGREYLKLLRMFDDLEGEEGGPNDRELRSHVIHLVVEAYRLEEISRGRLLDLAKILEISGEQLLHLAEAAKHTVRT